MKYTDYEIWDFLLDDFFMGWVRNPNLESNEFWSNWIKTNPHKAAVLEKAAQVAKSIRYTDTQPLQPSEYNEMLESVVRRKRQSPRRMRLVLKIAAMVAIAAGIYFWRIGIIQKSGPAPNNIEVITKYNSRGRKSLITLPDGSQVKLNAESSLTFTSDFGIKDRQVVLQGEAFFDVKRNPEIPFVIKTGQLETKVLGTTFDIRFYPEEEKIQIVVANGEVLVSDKQGTSVVLNPHDVFEFDVKKGNIKRSVCNDFDRLIGWKDGLLIFENDPLNEVFEKIENWYGVKIEFTNDFQALGSFTGTYRNCTLKNVMEGVSYASGFRYNFANDSTIVLSRKAYEQYKLKK